MTGAVLPDGEAGELVLTSLTKEAMPLIRYRTRDLTRLLPGTARTMRRIERVKGRSDDMLIIRGVNVFPSQIEAVLAAEPRLAPHYVLEVTRPERLDELAVLVETRPEDGAGTSEDERAGLEAQGRASHQGAYRCNLRGAGRSAGHDRAVAGQGEAGHRSPAEGIEGKPEMDALVPASGASPEDPTAVLLAAGIPADVVGRVAGVGADADRRPLDRPQPLRGLLAAARRRWSRRCRQSPSETPPKPQRRRWSSGGRAKRASASSPFMPRPSTTR